MNHVRAHEADITRYALQRLTEVEGLRLFGPSDLEQRGGVVSFTLGEAHPHDVAQVLDAEGIAVRGGDHCAKPLHRRFGNAASTRASFYVYNTTDEVDALVTAVEKAQRMFA
jgi:cysteine desulfurase/selenocysteine lyase